MTEEKDLDPDDPILRWPGPHEVSAVGRMHLAGNQPADIMRLFKMRGTKFVRELNRARLECASAEQAGRPIHFQPVKEGTE